MVSKVVPKGSQTSQTSILNPNWLPNAAQSDVLGIIFRRLWIVGALLSFLFLASLLGCWGSQWSYKRYYKAHGSSNAHATTAHYHQKNVRVGGMRRQPLKCAAAGPCLRHHRRVRSLLALCQSATLKPLLRSSYDR